MNCKFCDEEMVKLSDMTAMSEHETTHWCMECGSLAVPGYKRINWIASHFGHDLGVSKAADTRFSPSPIVSLSVSSPS
jgi:hypothetical protein